MPTSWEHIEFSSIRTRSHRFCIFSEFFNLNIREITHSPLLFHTTLLSRLRLTRVASKKSFFHREVQKAGLASHRIVPHKYRKFKFEFRTIFRPAPRCWRPRSRPEARSASESPPSSRSRPSRCRTWKSKKNIYIIIACRSFAGKKGYLFFSSNK